ncbi:hypothetical protein NQ317_011021 [Molorchus minor]|uniref:Uncharacterized protein n=1 Tax=Molorchus minor TaxID=1323400 RepID=A0ABQ9IUI6_9CUCU|nr:hypothetical protein NQ317_011021 [Molorchus minor]
MYAEGLKTDIDPGHTINNSSGVMFYLSHFGDLIQRIEAIRISYHNHHCLRPSVAEVSPLFQANGCTIYLLNACNAIEIIENPEWVSGV